MLLSLEWMVEKMTKITGQIYRMTDLYVEELLERVKRIEEKLDTKDIVRCKDCKHHTQGSYMGYGYCGFHKCLARENDYCSWGERREDD